MLLTPRPVLSWEFATEVAKRLQAAGHRALFAGGWVRNELLGRAPADYDIATSATPDQLKSLFRKCNDFGASFGVVEVPGPYGDDGEWWKVQVSPLPGEPSGSEDRSSIQLSYECPMRYLTGRSLPLRGECGTSTTG